MYTRVRKVLAPRTKSVERVYGRPQHSSSARNMAPPYTQAVRYDQNRDIAALADYGLGYKKIAKQIGINPSTVRNVVKRYRERGHVHDAPRSGRPTKITKTARKKIEAAVEDNPRATLRQITDLVYDLHFGHTTVDKVIKQSGFRLTVPRKKPFLKSIQKEKRLDWCRRRRRWREREWRKMIWLDEAKVEYTAHQPGRRIRIKPGQEFNDKNLAPSFQSGRVSVGCWAAYIHRKRTQLVWVRQRTAKERVSKRDRLGLNSVQYATEINKPYLLPFIQSLDLPIDSLKVVEDNACYHAGALNTAIQSRYGIKKLPLPPNSPDLNPIENAWHILKAKLRKRFTNSDRRPHNAEELWRAMQEEWDTIDQKILDKLLDQMPKRIEAVITAEGGHTKW